jgi:hypothetical protein
MSPQGRTSYRKKNTREYRYLLDDQIGFGKKKRIDPLLKALVLERATELSSQKAGRNVLPQNQECTVSPEVVKRLVHHLREEEKKAEEIPEKKWQPTQKKLLSLVIEKDEDHVPLKEQRGNHQTKRKKRNKSSILAKLVYVHEGRETSGPGRAKLKNPHDFARRFEDTEASSRSSSTWRRTTTFNR